MKKLFVVALLLASPAFAQTAAPSKTREHVQTLASERFGGREAGTDGERLAGDYIAAQLAGVGAKPLPGKPDMFLPFEFTAGAKDAGSEISVRYDKGPAFSANGGIIGGFVGGINPDGTSPSVRALSFSDDAELTAGVVFAGYGIVVPDSQNFGYDSY